MNKIVHMFKQLRTMGSKHRATTNSVAKRLSYDEDGYPSEEALYFIENYNPSDTSLHPIEFMKLVQTVWAYAGWGWKEEEIIDVTCNRCIHYSISTAGWSGNESVVHALKNNKNYFWTLYWESSRRGGHYTFIIKK